MFRLFAIVTLPFGLLDVGPAYAAHHREGTPGVFVAQRRECRGRAGCGWYGDFRSLDGRVERDNVLIDSGDEPWSVGHVVKAQDTGDRAVVYPADGGWDWLIVSLVILLDVGILAHWPISNFRHRSRGSAGAG